MHKLLSGHVALFLCLSSMFLIYPHLVHLTQAKMFLDILFTSTIIISLTDKNRLPKLLWSFYLVIGLAATVSTWLGSGYLQLGRYMPLFYTLFFGISVIIHLKILVEKTSVDFDNLLGAACCYIMIGMFFASINAILLQLDPSSILMPETNEEPIYQLIYYSFVTLTTVGYGDILPMSTASRMLAAYEAIIGQVFVAVVVGILVGKHISGAQKES